MLTNKEIRQIPIPEVTDAVREVVLREGLNRSTHWGRLFHAFCVTFEKHKGVLVLNVFAKTIDSVTLDYRFFMEKTECKLQKFFKDTVKGEISDANLYNCLERSCGPFSINAVSITERSKLIDELCNLLGIERKDEYTLDSLLFCYRDTIAKIKSDRKKIAKRKKIDEIMSVEKKLPKDFDKTVQNAIDGAHYGFFNRKTGYCTCSKCGATLHIQDLAPFIEKDKGICPKCKVAFEYASYSRRTSRKNSRTAVFIQAAGHHKLLVRYFDVLVTYPNYTAETSVGEVIRTLIDFDALTDNEKVKDFEWYYDKDFDNRLDWVTPRVSMWNPDGLHFRFWEGTVHQNGLTAEFKKADLGNYLSNYREVIGRLIQKPETSVYQEIKYIEAIALKPCIEKLTKCGLWNLAKHYYEGRSCYAAVYDVKAKSLQEMFGVTKEMFKQMLECDPTYEDMRFVRYARVGNHYNRTLKECIETSKYFHYNEEDALKLSKSDERKLRVYVENNHINIRDYFDYIHNANKLQYNTKAEIVRYPKNFKKAHDDAATEVKAKTKQIALDKVNQLLEGMHKMFDFTDEEAGLLIKAPDEAKDIIAEGERQHICVGSYLDKVMELKSVILFVRKITEPDKPFVTVEVDPESHHIVQARAFANKNPEDYVWRFLDKFKAKIAV